MKLLKQGMVVAAVTVFVGGGLMGCGENPQIGYRITPVDLLYNGIDEEEESLRAFGSIDLRNCISEENDDSGQTIREFSILGSNGVATFEIATLEQANFINGLVVRLTDFVVRYRAIPGGPQNQANPVEVSPVIINFGPNDGPAASVGIDDSVEFEVRVPVLDWQSKIEYLEAEANIDPAALVPTPRYNIRFEFFFADNFGNTVSSVVEGVAVISDFADECN